MDPELRKLLEDTNRLSQDNNKMLHSMRRSMRWSQVMTFFYWLFIIGSAVGAFYFIQPYWGKLINTYNSASGVLNNIKQFQK